MKTNRDEVYAAIDGERSYQDAKYEEPKTLGDELLLLQYYVAAATHNRVNKHPVDPNGLRSIRKVAGIAVRCMETHGAPKR